MQQQNGWTRPAFLIAFVPMLAAWQSAIAADFPLPPYDEAITLPVEVDGTTHLFLLDSGASTVFLHSNFRSRLSGKSTTHSVNSFDASQLSAAFYAAPRMSIAKAAWTCPKKVGCLDLSTFQAATGRQIEGVLGTPFFNSRIVQFDFDASVVRTFAHCSPKPDWGSPHKIKFSNIGTAMVQLRLAGSEVEWFVLDTGFSGSVALNWAVFHKLKSTGDVQEGDPYTLATATGLKSMRRGRLSSISLGDVQHKNVAVTSNDGECRVGLSFLRRYQATFDLHSERLYLQKGARFGQSENVARIGFSCVREGSRTVLKSIARGSFAEAAGLKPGDELMRVGNHAVRGRPIAEIVWLVRQSAAANKGDVTLKVQRDAASHDLVLSLGRTTQHSGAELVED